MTQTVRWPCSIANCNKLPEATSVIPHDFRHFSHLGCVGVGSPPWASRACCAVAGPADGLGRRAAEGWLGWPLGNFADIQYSGFPCYMVDMVDDHFHPFSMLETFLYSWWLMHIMVEMAHLWVYLFLPNKVWAVFHVRWPLREIDQQLRHDGKFWCIWEK